MRYFTLLLLLLSSTIASAQDVCLNEEENRLYDLIMEYRKSKKLKPIPYSSKLTKVAQAHVRDLMANYEYSETNKCNLHTWSSKGSWTSCCYTDDHAKAECMWQKPKEIAGYEGIGFEIAYYASAGANALEGIEGWKKSSGHNPLLINSGKWKDNQWKALGIGVYGSYAVVWFGEEEDKSVLKNCD